MPPKSSNKKAATASWYHCEKCEAHITSNDRNNHDKVCPIPEHGSGEKALEYIRNGVLYTVGVARKTFEVEELKEMPLKYVNKLLFMSEGAIRLARFHIGQQVMVTAEDPKDTPPLIRSIWPIPEKFLTTIFATEEDFNLYWSPFKGCALKIQRLAHGAAVPARTVWLRAAPNTLDEFTDAQIRDVARILKQEIKNLAYAPGSSIHMDFFNKPLTFTVAKWQPYKVGEAANKPQTLEETFKNLSIRSQAAEIFEVTCGTCLEIERQAPPAKRKLKRSVNKSEIGGLDKELALVEEAIGFALGYTVIPEGLKISRGLLLYGATGCGKSMICGAMCSLVQQKTGADEALVIKINTSELFSKYLGETEKNLSVYFEQAYRNHPKPTLIIVEDVHNLCPKRELNELTKRVAVAFLGMLDDLHAKAEAQRVFLLATTSNMDALNSSLRRCGRIDCEVEVPVPAPQGRADILRCLLSKLKHNLKPEQIKEIADVTHAFVGADLANLISSAFMHVFKAQRKHLEIKDVHDSLSTVKPSAMREVLIENPNVLWADIGGQSELKLKLKQSIEWPLLHPEKFQRLGIKPPRGILMFGPPGCSKTMIAKALATESQVNFLSIKGPELFSMWVGESERAVREVFRKARQVAPSIVFFDEIDAISGERSEGGSGSGSSVKERVLTQLLTELDGVEELQNVTIVAATNRPDMIDKALLRPGRIDRIVYVGLPDEEARREIFTIKLAKMPVAADVNLDALVQRTEGYSGAEIQAVCHEAALKTLEESFDAEHVSWSQFEYALGAVTARTSPELLHLYDEYLKRS